MAGKRRPRQPDDGEGEDSHQPAPRPADPRRPRHRDYQIALGLVLGQSPADLAAAHDVELTYVLTAPAVIEAEKRLQHMHRLGAPAAKGVLLDALPEVLNALVCVAGDPGHRAWAIAAKLYLDRVLPVIESSHVHHTHEVDVQSREVLATASASLAQLVETLAPKVLAITEGKDITARVLRGEAARPVATALPDRGDR